jgi:hypothetical protein
MTCFKDNIKENSSNHWINLLNVTNLEHIGMTVYLYEATQGSNSDTVKSNHIAKFPNDSNVINVRSINEDFDLFVVTTKCDGEICS